MTTTTKTTHFFLRNHGGHRVGVVAMRYYTRPQGGAGVTVAISLCHDHDPWRSSTGVAAARGRLDARERPALQRRNVTYHVDDDVSLADDVFSVLAPSGFAKRRIEVNWEKMQSLFEKQWAYLTTPKPETIQE